MLFHAESLQMKMFHLKINGKCFSMRIARSEEVENDSFPL